MSVSVRALALVGLLGPLVGLAAVSRGQEDGKKPAKVRVSVVAILASEKGDKVAPQLKAIAEEIRKICPKLKSFRVDTMTCRSLAVNESATFPLLKGENALVVVRQGMDSSKKVELAITPPCQGEIVYRTVCGKFLPVITRCRNEKGERLILAFRVQPCHGK